MFIVRLVAWLISLPVLWAGQLASLFKLPAAGPLLEAAWWIGGDGYVANAALADRKQREPAEAVLARALDWLARRPRAEIAAYAGFLAVGQGNIDLTRQLLARGRELGDDPKGLLDLLEFCVVMTAGDKAAIAELISRFASRRDLPPEAADLLLSTQLSWAMSRGDWPEVERRARHLWSIRNHPTAAAALWALDWRQGRRRDLGEDLEKIGVPHVESLSLQVEAFERGWGRGRSRAGDVGSGAGQPDAGRTSCAKSSRSRREPHEFSHGHSILARARDRSDLSRVRPCVVGEPAGRRFCPAAGTSEPEPVPTLDAAWHAGDLVPPVRLGTAGAGQLVQFLAASPRLPVDESGRSAGQSAVGGDLPGIDELLPASIPLRRVAAVGDAADAYDFLKFAVLINAMLAVLNLLPIPPLDGSKIWPCVLPHAKAAIQPKNGMFFLDRIGRFAFHPCDQSDTWRCDASSHATDASLQTPSLFAFYREVGHRSLDGRQWEQAEADFTAALAINPCDDRSLSGRAIARLCLKKLSEARADIEEAIAIRPLPEYLEIQKRQSPPRRRNSRARPKLRMASPNRKTRRRDDYYYSSPMKWRSSSHNEVGGMRRIWPLAFSSFTLPPSMPRNFASI